MTAPNAWRLKVLVAICTPGGTDVQFNAKLDSFDGINFGERGVEYRPLLNTGRLDIWEPEGDAEVKFGGYFVGMNPASVNKLFFSNDPVYSSGYYYLNPSQDRDKMRVTILVTNNSAQTDATAAVPAGSDGERYVLADGYLTVNNITWGDEKHFKGEFTFKFPPRDEDAANCYFIEDNVETGAELPSIASYTTSVKW